MTEESIKQEVVDYAYKNLKGIPKGNKEYEKMILQLPYNCYDHELLMSRNLAHERAIDYADIRMKDYEFDPEKHYKAREDYLRTIFGKLGDKSFIEAPFFVDYGFNVSAGKNFYCNFNCTFLDCCLIVFGDNCMCGPNVTFCTPTHAINPERRLAGEESAGPITVGDNVWFGANAVVLQDITIGDNSIIGAGAVVTKDVPANTVVVGSPARVVKHLTLEQDKLESAKHLT